MQNVTISGRSGPYPGRYYILANYTNGSSMRLDARPTVEAGVSDRIGLYETYPFEGETMSC